MINMINITENFEHFIIGADLDDLDIDKTKSLFEKIICDQLKKDYPDYDIDYNWFDGCSEEVSCITDDYDDHEMNEAIISLIQFTFENSDFWVNTKETK